MKQKVKLRYLGADAESLETGDVFDANFVSTRLVHGAWSINYAINDEDAGITNKTVINTSDQDWEVVDENGK